MTVNIFPAVHDVLTEHPTPRGFNTPQTITPPTHDAAVTHRALATPGSAGPGAIVAGVPPPALPALGRYTAILTDKNGGVVGGTLLNAVNPGEDKWTVSSIKWTLNGFGGATLSGPVHDPELAALFDSAGNVRDDREIQISRDDIGILQTVIPSPRITLGPATRRIEMQCPGVAYHLSRKYVGRNNEAPDFITNGSFDTNVLNWTGVGTTPSWQSSPYEDTPGSMLLDTVAAGNFYASQTILVPAQPFATFMWLNAWIYLDASISVHDLATSGRGLWTVWRVGSTVVWQQGVSPDWRNVGEWQQVSTKVFIPANQVQTMEVRLYAPKGKIRWDAVTAHREERLNCEGPTPGAIIGCLVTHAQDTGLNKIDMNINVDTSRGEGTAVLVRRYKYAEAAKISNAMSEMASLQGGCDWLCEVPATNSRIVYTMERTGYDVGSGQATLTWGGNLVGVEQVWNPDQRADQVRVQGRGSGDEVTEAFWDDPDSDLGWEFIRRTSIEGTPHPQDQADGLGRLFRRPITLVLTVARTVDFDPAYQCRQGNILPGRLVQVNVVEGIVNINERFKILDTELIPAGGGQPGDLVKLSVTPVSMLEDV